MTTNPIHNYDQDGNATYRQDFWENANRAYEDRVERIALERLLQPAQGQRLIEFGAGFGRLSSFFEGYEQVILVDYAKSQLEDARSRLGDGKYIYVAANLYHLPFAERIADAATLIRVIHHIADVPQVLSQIRASLSDGGLFILEFANKRNLKSILRYRLGRQTWNPSDFAPIEFVKLHWDFHPHYMRKTLDDSDFQIGRELAVSYFRLGILKRLIPLSILSGLDAILQPSGWLYSPSVFVQNRVAGTVPAALPRDLFKCLRCQHVPLRESGKKMGCANCGTEWSIVDGIYDFRTDNLSHA